MTEVETEAMRIARLLVKVQLKAQDIKVSGVKSESITKAAKALIEMNPSLIQYAKREISRLKV